MLREIENMKTWYFTLTLISLFTFFLNYKFLQRVYMILS
jgi:hypothetical protein